MLKSLTVSFVYKYTSPFVPMGSTPTDLGGQTLHMKAAMNVLIWLALSVESPILSSLGLADREQKIVPIQTDLC